MRIVFYLLTILLLPVLLFAQNVGIGTSGPTEKLHIDSGSVKIGLTVWDPLNIKFLKFGDGNFITLGEEEEDDKFTIRAKELLFRPSAYYTTIPISIQGTTNYSHFFYGGNEDTYIRGGKDNSKVIINDITGGKVGIGMSNPTRGIIEQYGSVGNTSALFGSDGAGVSLQKNLPAIGLNHYFDGANNRNISSGYSSQIGLDQNDGTLYVKVWSTNSIFPNLTLSNSNATRKFHINRFGKVRIGFGFVSDPAMPDLSINQNSVTPSSGYDRSNGITLGYNAGINDPSTINLSVGDLIDGPVWQNALKIFGFPSGGPVAIIHPNTGEYIRLSDRQVKKDINSLEMNTLQKLLQLKPAIYHMANDNDGAKYKYGFISQEVEEIFPDIVFQSGNYKMLAYESFIPIAIKSIQEQQQQIEVLKKDNETLKTEMTELRKLILSKQ